MQELGSKQDLEQLRDAHERETDDRVDRTKEHQEEVDAAADAWNRQDASPALAETAAALRRLADALDARIEAEAERHAGEVTDALETERAEVSEPTREAEEGERDAARSLEADSHGAGRYVQELLEGAEQHDDASEFLDDVADGNEAHQEGSREEMERLNDEARRRAEALNRF